MQLYQDPDNGWAHVSSISEFLLTQPCLSFAILDASRRKFKKLADKELAHMDDVTTGQVLNISTHSRLSMFSIHAGGLCMIILGGPSKRYVHDK